MSRGDYVLGCLMCGYRIRGQPLVYSLCPRCGGALGIELADHVFKVNHELPGLWRYSTLLPPIYSKYSLGEGMTPINSFDGVLIKNERFNPTGSYTDRASAVIVSYVKDLGIHEIRSKYVKDFTKSFMHYSLNAGLKADVVVDDITSVELDDITYFAQKGISLLRNVEGSSLCVGYVNPLTIEGLKTIVFELHEKGLKAETVVVPAETGLLALSLLKGLRDLRECGLDVNYEITAATIKGLNVPLLSGVKGVRVVEVPEDEVYYAFKRLIDRGLRTKPLSALSFYVAQNIGNSVAVITMGYRSLSTNKSVIKKLILDALAKRGPMTAYEIWRSRQTYTLRAVYKAVKSMEARGEICFDIKSKGRRKVKLYRLCS